MAVLVNKQSDHIVEGAYRASADVVPGQFVIENHANKTVAVVADDIAGDGTGIKLVLQINNAIDEEMVADSDVVYKSGELVPTRTLKIGDVFTTDQFTVTDYDAVALGDTFAVGAGGKAVPVGTRTPKLTFKVKDKTTLFGKNALKFVVETV